MTTHEPIPVEITLKVSTNDFEGLWEQSMNWKDTDWAAQDGRFEPMPDYTKWDRAYWFDSLITLMVARSYLQALNYDYQQILDTNGDIEMVLLTNFGGKL